VPRGPLSRRDVLTKCFAAGLLIAAPPLTEARVLALWQEVESRKRKPTPPNDLGPFYKVGAPQMNKLSRPGDPGLPLAVSGGVFDTRGSALPGATLEIWHADPFGQYDNKGFHYRAQLSSGQGGAYSFETNMPGHYPTRVCQHIHYKVSAPGHKTLITQLYFATDPVFEGDPDRNYRKDPLLQTSELIRPVRVFADPQAIHAAALFEIVLEPA
jgi:protocatechuate 3,4-dioxygenase beta subunit